MKLLRIFRTPTIKLTSSWANENRFAYRAGDGAEVMAPHVKDQIDVISPSIPLASRLSLDPELKRMGAIDGGWWPRSRNANVEPPDLVSSLNARAGAVGVDARDWDDIPRRIIVRGHVVRIGRYAHVNHKIIATRGPQDQIMLLVTPPHAPTAAAKSALARAATGKNSGRPEEILAASGILNEAEASPPRTAAEKDDHPQEPGILIADSEAGRAMVTEDARPGDIGRWLDDGAPSPASP
jgi:hypothetical protein